jgi:hypothetical protein
MQLKAALSFPFRGPSAWANLGSILVCTLIPIVGAIVISGYIIRVDKVLIENIHADAPRFDFGKFSEYLKKGVTPFLLSLILIVIILPLTYLFIGGIIVIAILLKDHIALMVLLILLTVLLIFMMIFACSFLLAPLIFKAGLEESFSAAFDKRYFVDYFRRVGALALGLCSFCRSLPCVGRHRAHLRPYQYAALSGIPLARRHSDCRQTRTA